MHKYRAVSRLNFTHRFVPYIDLCCDDNYISVQASPTVHQQVHYPVFGGRSVVYYFVSSSC